MLLHLIESELLSCIKNVNTVSDSEMNILLSASLSHSSSC